MYNTKKNSKTEFSLFRRHENSDIIFTSLNFCIPKMTSVFFGQEKVLFKKNYIGKLCGRVGIKNVRPK